MRLQPKKWHVLFIILVICSFFSSTVLAQRAYNPGKVILKDGTELNGYLSFKDGTRSPLKVYFKKQSNEESREYYPAELRSFSTDKAVYQTAVVDKETSAVKASELYVSPDFQIVTDTVFIKMLTKGDKKIGRYSEENKNNFYIWEDGQFVLLRYKKYLRASESGEVILERKDYLSQLSEFFSDCDDIHTALMKTDYNVADIIKLYNRYVSCIGKSELQTADKSDKIRFNMVVSAGGTIASARFNERVIGSISNGAILDPVQFTPSLRTTGGVAFQFNLPGNNYKHTLAAEVFLISYNLKHDQIYSFERVPPREASIRYGFNYTKINLIYGFEITRKDNFSIDLIGGLTSGLLGKEIGNEISIAYFDIGGSVSRSTSDKVLWRKDNYELGFVVGVSMNINRLVFQTRFERASGASPFIEWSTPVNYLHLTAGYRVFK